MPGRSCFALRSMLIGVLLCLPVPAFAGAPLNDATLDTATLAPGAPVTFDLDGGSAAPALKLDLPKLGRGSAGIDALMGPTASIQLSPGLRAKPQAERAPAVPAPAPSVMAQAPSPRLKLTTQLERNGRTLGEFKTRDWNALGTAAQLTEAGSAMAAMELPAVDVLKVSMPPEKPHDTKPEVAEVAKPKTDTSGTGTSDTGTSDIGTSDISTSDTSPRAMAEAERALADARAAGLKRAKKARSSGEPLLVLPNFGTSSFQVGASFSLSGSASRIAFGEKPAGPFERGFGLSAPAPSLRLSNPEETPSSTTTPKDDAGKRLWTGVVFNF